MVAKAEFLNKGANPRFVVTSLPTKRLAAQALYEDFYCVRGAMENRIKEQQLDLFADRTSAATMRANQLRLYLSSAAYMLMYALRRLGLKDTPLARAQCQTIRLKLLKIGARIRLTVRFYAESWALVHYLMIGNPDRRGQLSSFSNLLQEGRSLEESFLQAFATDTKTLETELRNYIRNAVTWNAANYTLDERLADLDDVEVVELSEALENFYKGDLLLRIRRPDDARTYLEKSIELDPTLEQPLTAMFFLHDSLGNSGLAEEFLDRAVRLDHASYLPRLLYGRNALMSGGDLVEKGEVQLRRVIEMRPNLLEPYLLLGQSLMRSPDTLDEALRLLKAAISRRPSNPRTAVVYAQALWYSGETERARNIVASIARNAPDPDVRNHAQVTLDQIESFGDIGGRASPAADRPLSDEPPERPRTRRRDEDGASASGSTVVTEFYDTRLLPEGTKQVEGLLVLLDCSMGLRIQVIDDDTTMEFVTATPDSIQFLSYSVSLADFVTCGRIVPALPVRISYEPDETASAPTLGTPLRIEFLSPKPQR